MVLSPNSIVLDCLTGAVGERALAQGEVLLMQARVSFQREIYFGEPAEILVAMVVKKRCQAIIMGAVH